MSTNRITGMIMATNMATAMLTIKATRTPTCGHLS